MAAKKKQLTETPRLVEKVYQLGDVKVGVRNEGKCESGYDCGMDYTYGIRMPYTTIRAACDKVAIDILKRRQRYSSLDKYLNVPSGLPAKKSESKLGLVQAGSA